MERTIDRIVIHCAATPNFQPCSIEQIDAMHKERGFHRTAEGRAAGQSHLEAVGYHFFINLAGEAKRGRTLDEIGAHAKGYNRHSIGICMAGTDDFTAPQWWTLRGLIIHLVGLITRTNITDMGHFRQVVRDHGLHIEGHRDLSPDLNGDGVVEEFEWLKTCPGFDVAEWLNRNMEPPA